MLQPLLTSSNSSTSCSPPHALQSLSRRQPTSFTPLTDPSTPPNIKIENKEDEIKQEGEENSSNWSMHLDVLR